MEHSAHARAPLAPLWWGIAAAASSVLALLVYRGFAGDDTFIHLQYARNLAAGHGFSFTPGEPSYGSTSPAWTLLVAIAGRASGGAFYAAAKLLSAAFTAAAVILFFLLARRFVPSRLLAIAATFAFACDPWLLKWGGCGMETSLAVSIVLLSTILHLRARSSPRVAPWAALLGVGVLVRPELVGLFLLGLFDRHVVLRRPLGELARASAAFAAPVVPWLIFAISAFGDVVPATVRAKSGHMPIAEALSRTVEILGSTSSPAILAALFGGVLFLRRDGLGPRARAWILEHIVLWGWALGLPAAYVITRSYVASRYLLLCMPFFLLLGFAALAAARPPASKRLGLGLLGLLLVASIAVQATVIYPRTRFVRGVDEPHIALGEWLRNNSPPDALVATHEVGAIGYFSERPILDTAGLVSKDALPFVIQYRIADLLRGAKPVYYVSSGDERTDKQVFEPFGDRMTLLFEVSAHRGGSSGRFAVPQKMGIYRFDWSE